MVALSEQWKAILIPLAVSSVSVAILLMGRALLIRWLRARAELPGRPIYGLALKVLRTPSYLWAIIIAIHWGVSFSEMPERYAEPLRAGILAVLILSITIAVANFVTEIVHYSLSRAGSSLSESGVIRAVLRTVIFGMGVMMMLSRLGISITPILTAAGVGGLAVALALQDSMANMFSGIQLLIERAVVVGDRVKLENGQEGVVSDIGWRTTKIHLSTGDQVILPNTKFAQGILVRFAQARPKEIPTVPSPSHNS